MSSIPKVSIIIPVYNVEKYLRRCLDTVINQTLKEIEIIIVNDDTKDNSMDICLEYEKKDSRVKVYSKQNEGLGLTRNYGMERAKGEYIAFLDSDDFVDLDFYEKMYNNITTNNTDAVFANVKLYFREDKILQKDKMPFKHDVIPSKKFMYNLLHIKDNEEYGKNYMRMCVWRSLYSRKIIEEKNIKFVSEREFISEDILFNIDFCMFSNTISFVKDTYYYYCYNENSLTKTYRKDRFEKDIILYKELIRKLTEYGEYEKIKAGLASYFLGYVRGAIKQEVSNSPNSKQEINKNLDYILNNSIVTEANKIAAYDNMFRMLISLLIKLKAKRILTFIYKIKKGI